jgi:MraZ protein
MIRFSSTCEALMDDKGRVVLPSSFKKSMGELADEPLIIEKDIYKPCLNIYPERFWYERLMEIEKTLNPFDEEDDNLLTKIYANYTTVTMAPNGRINIPSNYLEHSGISRKVVFAGKGVSITLWDEKAFTISEKEGKSLRELYKERLGNPQKAT